MTDEGDFRGFYAVPFDPAAAGALERAARKELEASPEDGWRPVPAERLHITLKFLGDAPTRLLPGLREALCATAGEAAPFPVAFGGWIRLPGPRDPRVFAVEVSDPTGTLPRLAASLEARAESLGFPKEGRPFLCHATVARRRGGGRRPGRSRRRAKSATAVPGPASTVGVETNLDRIVLMKSTLGPEGPAYEVGAEAALGGRG